MQYRSNGPEARARRVAEVSRLRALAVRASRTDPDQFAQLVLKDEQDFKPVRQARHHREFQRIWTEHRESVVVAHPESGKCETADSRVLLAGGGEVSVSRLAARARVVVADPDTRTWRDAWAGPVEHNGERQVVRVETAGQVLTVTREHPLRAWARGASRDAWVEAADLREGDELVTAGFGRAVVVRVDHPREPEPTWALEVEDPAHCYVSNGVVSHNTNQAVARVLWMLGRNPRLKVLFVSKTIGAAEERLKLARQYIEESDALHEVFPDLRLDRRPGARNHSRALTVEREGAYAIKDASIKAVGLNGNVLGSRVDLVVLDDWVDFFIARTEAPRRAAIQWFRSNNCYGRLTADGRVWILTNAWHPLDPNEVLGSPPPDGSGFYLQRFPSLDAAGAPTYPDRWDLARLERARVKMGSFEFSRAHLCRPQEEGAQACKPAWLERCERRGLGMPVFTSLQTFLEDDRAQPGERRLALAYRDALAPKHAGARPSFGRAVAAAQDMMEAEDGRDWCPVAVLHGVDSAFQTHNASDLSAIVTAAVYANGHKKLLRVVSGHWDIVELVRQITLAWCAFGGTFVVENNGGAEHVVTLVEYATPIPVVGFLTGWNKLVPNTGIHTLFAAFEAGRWVIPSSPAVVEDEVEPGLYEERQTEFLSLEPEVAALARECLTFDPHSHTGDRLMATWFVQRYAVRLFGGAEPDLDRRVPEVEAEQRIVVPPPAEIVPPPPPRILPPGRFGRLRA